MGKDARGLSFQISLTKRYYGPGDPETDITQIREQNPDGDLRYMESAPIRVGQVYLCFVPLADSSTLQILPGQIYGSLNTIDLRGDDAKITIYANLYEYPEDGKRTLFSDLLDTNTTMIAIHKLQSIIDEYGITEEACDIIKAELEKEYSPLPPPTPAWVLPTAICGGVVVLAGAVTATAVVIRRKKRGAAAADTPAEEENA